LRLLGSLSPGNNFTTAGLAKLAYAQDLSPEAVADAETLARLFEDAMQRAVSEVLEV